MPYNTLIHKGTQMTIDLSKYIGQKVVVTFDESASPTLSGNVSLNNESESYPYSISGYYFNRNGEGYTLPQIVSITSIYPPMNGIAQRSPNINLADFEGQRVYVKGSAGKHLFGKVTKSPDSRTWHIVNPNGVTFLTWDIEEIYGEGAYEIRTKETFDEPSDSAVEKAREAIKDLTEEQIAKLLHSLKK
jgi:hypothetical protein